MKRRAFLSATASAAALLASHPIGALAKTSSPMTSDPLLAPFDGPHGGVPPFNRIRPADFKPALLKGMDLQRAELQRIVEDPRPPSFENTIAALEDSGRPYNRANTLLGIYTSTLNDKTMQAVEKEMAPVVAAFSDEIVQNSRLFARIKAVHDQGTGARNPEQKRLAEVVHSSFARRGAGLAAPQKERLKQINQELAALFTTFSQNQLADEEEQSVVLENEADLAGLPDAIRTAARAAAEGTRHPNRWVIRNTRSSAEPFLTYSTRRDLREKVWRMWISRGESQAHDNKPVIRRILALRSERARLLGHPTHAHWIISDNMAGTPDAAMNLLMKVWRAAVARVREEVADMQAIANASNGGTIEAWDYRFYAEKVRKAKYDLDQNDIKPYLQADKLRDGMFWAAHKVYGLRFREIQGVPVYHKDVRVWEVTRNGRRVGLWYFDPYARDGKRSGAWMNEYRTQEAFRQRVTPIVSNNSNFIQGRPGEPVLISWDDAVTLFHEFGHALHGLNSNVRYPTLAGTNTKRDFVEFPSQLHEHWLPTPEVLNQFAVHVQSGQPIPHDLVARIDKAKNFNQGFKTTEYLMSAIYDLKIHSLPSATDIDPTAFERSLFEEIGAPREIVMRHRPTHFAHIFSDDAYSAGYYSYLWADTLTADAAEAIRKGGGFFNPAMARKLQRTLMSVGNSVPPEQAFRNFRGRDVDSNALMRDRGFPVTT